MSEYAKARKNVANTVIHVQAADKAFTITATGMQEVFRILMAFLLENRLMDDRQLVFLSDGAKDIKENAEKFFSWRPYIYYLANRIKELCSMCIKLQKDKKGEIIKKILNYLWVADIDGAIAYIRSFRDSIIKNAEVQEDMCAYLERKRDNICYHALRRAFKLKHSSNAAEKSNDLVVADRQKHNEMSWSFGGSGSLAILSMASRNNTLSLWIKKDQISIDIEDYEHEVKTHSAA